MKPPVIFALVVRGFGVFLLYQSIHAASLFATLSAARTFDNSAQFMRGAVGQAFAQTVNGTAAAFASVVVLFLGALWFLFGAPPIQQWAYPNSDGMSSAANASAAQLAKDGPLCVSCERPMTVGAKVCPHCGWQQPY